MLAVVTVLAHRLGVRELGVYGLLVSLSGYLLVVQNAAGTGAIKNIAAAQGDARGLVYSSTGAVYAIAGVTAGVLVAAIGALLSMGIGLPTALEHQARLGAALIGLVTAIGWPLTVNRDALRASQLFVPVALTEIAMVIVYTGLVLVLVAADAPLSVVVAAGGSLPLLVGLACTALARIRNLGFRFRFADVRMEEARRLAAVAGYLSLSEAAAAGIYALDRAILGLSRSATVVGLYEGPVRAHNVFRALGAAVTVTAVPPASGYVRSGDERRLGELFVRGVRYTEALVVPLAVSGMVLSGPLLELWLGPPYRAAQGATTILLAHWLLNGCAGLLAAILIAGGRARELARYALAVAAANAALALGLTPPLGLTGIALATTVPYLAAFPYLLARALAVAPVGVERLARHAFGPALALGGLQAAALGTLRLVGIADDPVMALIVAAASVALNWTLFYCVWLRPDERQLVRDLLRGAARL